MCVCFSFRFYVVVFFAMLCISHVLEYVNLSRERYIHKAFQAFLKFSFFTPTFMLFICLYSSYDYFYVIDVWIVFCCCSFHWWLKWINKNKNEIKVEIQCLPGLPHTARALSDSFQGSPSRFRWAHETGPREQWLYVLHSSAPWSSEQGPSGSHQHPQLVWESGEMWKKWENNQIFMGPNLKVKLCTKLFR